LGEDALEQGRGWLWTGRLEHLQPGCSALGIGHHAAAGGATEEMQIEGGLLDGG
jgi:hypothetical protein